MNSKELLFNRARVAVSTAVLNDGDVVDGVTPTGKTECTIRVKTRRDGTRYYKLKLSEVM